MLETLSLFFLFMHINYRVLWFWLSIWMFGTSTNIYYTIKKIYILYYGGYPTEFSGNFGFLEKLGQLKKILEKSDLS